MTAFAESVTGRPQASAWITYLAGPRDESLVPQPLLDAQKALEGRPTQGSRPSLVLETPAELVFVTAKATSSHKTTQRNEKVLERWSGRQGWYDQVFKANIHTVAVEKRRYQLMRLWMLGSWMAAKSGKRFTLVVVSRASVDRKLEREFGKLVRPSDSRRLVHWTWDDIAELAEDSGGAEAAEDAHAAQAGQATASYLRGKSLGYDSAGRLRALCARAGS